MSEEEKNNGRVTLAVVANKVDDLRGRFDDHDSRGYVLLDRISTLEGKVWVIFWGTPILVTLIGVALGVLQYITQR